jgi:selenide,water dikinase
MADRSSVTLRLHAPALPLYAGALRAAEAGVRTGGDARNRAHLEGRVSGDAPTALEALAFDPQTSGGLLAAVTPQAAGAEGLAAAGFVVIGEVVDGPAAVVLA